MKYDEFLLPPGCKSCILPPPSGVDKAIELALFQEHRYAFFFWLKWTKKLGVEQAPPALISLDWHEDLAAPEGLEIDALKALNQDDPRNVALFCWEDLNSLNDGHILAAAYLNMIGDIYVVRKQLSGTSDIFEDFYGRQHTIKSFDSISELLACLKQSQVSHVFLDLDLDYFTESTELCGGGSKVKLVSDEVIHSILNPAGELLTWVFERLAGMTIATEPEFCGGIMNSNHLLSVVSNALFDPQILAADVNWRHL